MTEKTDFDKYLSLKDFVWESKWKVDDLIHQMNLSLIVKVVRKENLEAKEVMKMLEEIRTKLDEITKFPSYKEV